MTTEHCLRALSPVLCKGMANGSCLRDSGINPARFVEFLGCRRKKAPPVKQTTQFGYSVCFEKSSPASFCLCLRWQIKYLKAYRFFVKTGSHRASGEKKVAENVSTRIPPRRTLHSVCPLAGRMTFLWTRRRATVGAHSCLEARRLRAASQIDTGSVVRKTMEEQALPRMLPGRHRLLKSLVTQMLF